MRRNSAKPDLIAVAREAGVSTATVSRVLNRSPKVREETRRLVAAALRKLNYIPEGNASRTVAIFMEEHSGLALDSYSANLLAALTHKVVGVHDDDIAEDYLLTNSAARIEERIDRYEPLLERRFAALPFGLPVAETLALIRRRVPLFTEVNPLVMRELVLGSTLHAVPAGTVLFSRNDYTNSFYSIIAGSVDMALGEDARQRISRGEGQFFGEMSLLPAMIGKPLPPRRIFMEHEGNRFVRDGDWKIVALSQKPWELYNISTDPTEMHDLAAQQPARVDALSKAWEEWWQRLKPRQPLKPKTKQP